MSRGMKTLLVTLAGLAAILLFAEPVLAQSVTIDAGGEGVLTNRVLQLIALLTILSLAPSIVIMTTSFVRIVVVLSLLRTASGLQQAPPNMVLTSLAIFLTAFIMAPVFQQSYDDGIEPLMNQEIELSEAFTKSAAPIKTFMLAQTREEDLGLFLGLSNAPVPPTAEDTPLNIVAPAFMISELRRAFEIGFLYFIPFLIIDLVVSSILMSMGMMMLPPVIISLPFKLIFFVLVDGWRLVVGSLVQSFN
ncbi:MAG: flagellar type III secretion system pore protein FliP [Robiginitomaculum sp.]|nr:flagellar type III secretion system pore protein FliP [Robiginitomaculum sp.]MDQ7078165.1 flagellar type III secretion system pore protein FliP [Robiginitomaculum sp.]